MKAFVLDLQEFCLNSDSSSFREAYAARLKQMRESVTTEGCRFGEIMMGQLITDVVERVIGG